MYLLFACVSGFAANLANKDIYSERLIFAATVCRFVFPSASRTQFSVFFYYFLLVMSFVVNTSAVSYLKDSSPRRRIMCPVGR